MHADIEDFYGGRMDRLFMERVLCDREGAVGECEYAQFLRFNDNWVRKRGWLVYRLEARVVDDLARVCGSIDALFYHPDEPEGTLHMVDWKRSREIRYSSWENRFGRAPFAHLPDCNASHYAVQQNLYKAIIERYTSLKIVTMHLAVFNPEHEDYEVHPVPDLQQEVAEVLAQRESLFV